MKQHYTPTLVAALGLLWLAPSLRAAPILVDTSALAGQSGFVDFQFNPDTSGTLPLDATATINGFTGGTLGGVDALNSANETGTLPGSVVISNAGAVNSLVQAITFGSSLSFTPTFASTATPGADEGSTLQLFLLDSQQNTLATTDPAGADVLASVDMDATGAVGAPAVNALAAGRAAAVPEPGSAALLALGLPALALLARTRRR